MAAPLAVDPPRIGLVLGGGGAVGLAFHAGALLAIEHDLGWDPRTADLIVGTSAGSIVGALLRTGVSTDDLAAWCAGVEAGEGRREIRRVLDTARHARMPWRWSSRFPSPQAAVQAIGGRAALLPGVLSQLPFGLVDAGSALALFVGTDRAWPEDPLWITAVDADTTRLAVFGASGEPDVPLATAIAASCAIPGLFHRVEHGGRRYVDGGVQSASHAALAVDQRAPALDAVLVLSPMTERGRRPTLRPHRALRRWFGRRLDAELATCARAGVRTAAIEPDEAVIGAMGYQWLDRERVPRVLSSAFLAATAELDGDVAAMVRRAGRAVTGR